MLLSYSTVFVGSWLQIVAAQLLLQLSLFLWTVREAFASWLTPAVDRVKALFPVPLDKGSRDSARTELCAIQEKARNREDDVLALKQQVHTFQENREVSIKYQWLA